MRYFYIDTENISVINWCNSLHRLTSRDKVYIIYTTKSPHLPYEAIRSAHESPAKIELVHATNGTPNALDFILVTKLAEQCSSAPKSEHYIISEDKGYSPVIRYYLDKGVSVQKFSTVNQAITYEVVDIAKDSTLTMAI